MTEDYKSPEVTFKYYLPEHNDHLWLTVHASDMYSILHEIDQQCRAIIKYGDDSIETTVQLSQKIRDIIHDNIDMDKVK